MAIIRSILLLSTLFFISACATTNPPQVAIKRITPEALAKLVPAPVANYTLQDIVSDTQQQKTANEIIAKIKASDSRYDLSVRKLIELNQHGVDVNVLDYIEERNALAKQNDMAEAINKVEKEKSKALQQLNEERLMQMHQYYDPFVHPYFNRYYYHPYRIYR